LAEESSRVTTEGEKMCHVYGYRVWRSEEAAGVFLVHNGRCVDHREARERPCWMIVTFACRWVLEGIPDVDRILLLRVSSP